VVVVDDLKEEREKKGSRKDKKKHEKKGEISVRKTACEVQQQQQPQWYEG